MNFGDIIPEWLIENGYDGLFNPNNNCACQLSDLMPCTEPDIECVPGYKIPCPGPDKCELGGDCEFHIVAEKPVKSPQDTSLEGKNSQPKSQKT